MEQLSAVLISYRLPREFRSEQDRAHPMNVQTLRSNIFIPRGPKRSRHHDMWLGTGQSKGAQDAL